MIHVHVKLFAMARDLSGTDEVMLSLSSSSTIANVLDALLKQYPSLIEWKQYLRLAVNCEYVPLSYNLHDNDEVAVIPPVSGG